MKPTYNCPTGRLLTRKNKPFHEQVDIAFEQLKEVENKFYIRQMEEVYHLERFINEQL